MDEYKSIYQQLMEDLQGRGKINILRGEANYALISELNKEMATSAYEDKLKQVEEEELEVGQILINE